MNSRTPFVFPALNAGLCKASGEGIGRGAVQVGRIVLAKFGSFA